MFITIKINLSNNEFKTNDSFFNINNQAKPIKNIADPKIEKEILNVLKKSNNWTKSFQIIAGLIKKISPILLRRIVANLRIQNYPIIASNKGYKLSYAKNDIHKYVQTRLKEIRKEEKILQQLINDK